jgi:hypothetical protein
VAGNFGDIAGCRRLRDGGGLAVSSSIARWQGCRLDHERLAAGAGGVEV